MYRVKLACNGIPENVGPTAAGDIAEEFTHRPWHQNVLCFWDGSRLLLQANNDFVSDGSALADEYSDAIAACIAEGFDGSITVESVTALAGA